MFNTEVKSICIIGLGYIGLPTAALLANRGFNVLGVDVNENVVNTINQGEIHIVEPELDSFVKAAINSKKLKASLNPGFADVFILAVPTPFCDNHSPNLDYVFSAAKSIAPYIRPGNLIILESTSPVGTTEKMAKFIAEEGVSLDEIYIAYCPERVLPGQVMKELIENDRVVGGINPTSTRLAIEFYKSFVSGEVLATNARTAELCKLTENSYRDTNIAFANELSMICDKVDINISELRMLANRHPRVNILQPGCGVGGHCIAVDPWFIVSDFPHEARLIRKAREVNDFKSQWVIEKIKNQILTYKLSKGIIPYVALLGLSFKPNIDDLRESPALVIADAIHSSFPDHTLLVEPNIRCHSKFKVDTLSSVLTQANIFVTLVAHKEFINIISAIPSDAFLLDFCSVGIVNN
jgi:UDP-N-acetyl-D-mannosaminuronic acid dehydrogenase